MADVIDIRTRRRAKEAEDEPPQMRIIVGTQAGSDRILVAICEPGEDEVGFVVGMTAAGALDLAKKLRKTAKAVTG